MSARVLVLSEDPVGSQMGGNAIRAYEIARELNREFDVTLSAPLREGPPEDVALAAFPARDGRALARMLAGIDVVVTLPQGPALTAALRRSRAHVVYDLYDPKPLQLLEAHRRSRRLVGSYWATLSLDHLLGALASGDFFLAASERQRDLWIGAMLASRMLTPAAYAADPSLRRLIETVPFGLPDISPEARGPGPYGRLRALGAPGELVLWNGGLWNWLDPVGAVEAMALVAQRRPHARLVFMGRPPLTGGEQANGARARAAELGLLDSVVFFNDQWVDYNERADWLLAADCALSLHSEHLETRYSFRTRLLDCFWASLPVVCSRGDDLAELVSQRGLGAAVASGDPHASAAGVEEVLQRGRADYAPALAATAVDFAWSRVLAPLREFVAAPRRRVDASRQPPAAWSRGLAARSLGGLMRAARR